MTTQDRITVPVHRSLILQIFRLIHKYNLSSSTDTSIFPDLEDEITEQSRLYFELPREKTAMIARLAYEHARESADRVAALSLLARVASQQDLALFAHASDDSCSRVAAVAFSAALLLATSGTQTELSSEWLMAHHQRLCSGPDTTPENSICSVFVCNHWAMVISSLHNAANITPVVLADEEGAEKGA